MATFTPSVKRAIESEDARDKHYSSWPRPVYRTNPKRSWMITQVHPHARAGKGEVAIRGDHGRNDCKAVEHAEGILRREGVKYNTLQMPLKSDSEMVATVLRSAAVIVAAPTYEYKLFPPVAAALNELGRKRITGKVAFRFGSYGWSGGAEKELSEIMERNKMNWDFIESVEFEGAPKEEDLVKIEAGVLELIEKMKEKVM